MAMKQSVAADEANETGGSRVAKSPISHVDLDPNGNGESCGA